MVFLNWMNMPPLSTGWARLEQVHESSAKTTTHFRGSQFQWVSAKWTDFTANKIDVLGFPHLFTMIYKEPMAKLVPMEHVEGLPTSACQSQEFL